MAEITVDVGVRLKAMQSSVADLQKVLDGLQPNSSGFKALQRIIADINRDMDRLRIQTSKPFGSQNQFNQTEKTVDKLEESLEKVKITIDRIKFSDLKLDSSQTAQLDNFKQQLKDIKQEFTNFKADLKGQFLDNDFNKAFVEGINPNLLNKSFDEIVKNVENRVNSLGSALARAKADLENFQNAVKIGERISKASQTTNGVVSPEVMGQEMFDKFFQTNSKGIFSFKTGGGLKKGEIQQQFLDYLASEFQLTQSQIDQLKNQTASNIRKILAQEDFFNPQKGAAETANKKMDGAESAFTAASKSYENAAAVVARLTPLLSALSNEELSLEDKQKLVNQAIRQFEQDCVNGAKGSKTLEDSTKGLSSGLESFKQQLGQVNAQWLNLQKQQATFNSMKSAIVNFMGFNQVLNLTKKAVKEAMDHIKQLDTVMNGIAIVTDMTTADLWNQVDVYSEMAQRYGTSIQGAYEVSKIYYQAGYETNEVLTLMNETLKLSKISGLDYATTTDYMMTATRGFHMEVSEASKVVDVYSALAANTAVSQQELAEAMTRTASSMESVGTTFEEASAMIATMVATTRESANNIGSAMKSIASRYGELTKDPAKLMDAEGEAMSFNRVDTALKSVGISLQTVDHQFRSFTDVILELSEVWDTLDSVQQRYIATQFAGNRQQSRFLALVSNPDQIKENLEVAAESEDTGTLQALKALDSLETKLNQVQVAYQQFYTTIGVEEVWKTFLDGTKNVIDTLNNLPKLFGKVPLGAIAVIYDIVSLIKNVALKGLEEIASIWIQKTQEMTTQTQAESGKNRDNGTAWVDNFVSGIRSRIGEIRNVAKEAVDAANQEARDKALEQAKQNNPQPNPDFNASHLNDLIKQYDKTSGAEQLQASTAIMNEYGMTINSARSALEAYTKISSQATQAMEEAGQTALSGGQRFLTEAQGIAKAALSSEKLASTTSGLAMGLNTIAMLINTTSESGKRLAGTLMTVAGGLRAVGAVLQYVDSAGQMAFPWMAVITGIIGIVNGISTAYEDAQERLERLTKEAEELNNEAKKTKAEYSTLQRSADKLEELKEKRYESAEAAEEYQSAVEDLADKFPQLITGFDETGNAILDTTNMEQVLAEAREASAKATYKAAEAEYAKVQEELNQEKLNLQSLHSENRAYGSENQAERYNYEQRGILEFLYNDYFGFMNGTTESAILDQGDKNLIKQYEEYIKNIEETTGEKIEKDLYSFNDFINSLDTENSILDPITLQTINDWKNNLANIVKAEDTEQNKVIDNIESAIIAYNAATLPDEITETYNNLTNLIHNAKDQLDPDIYDDYITMLGTIGEVGEKISDINSRENVLNAQLKTTISGWMRDRGQANGDDWDVLNNNFFSSLATNEISNLVKTQYGGNWESAKNSFNENIPEILNELEGFYDDIEKRYNGEEILATLDKVYNDSTSYSRNDIITILEDYGITIDEEIAAALEEKYSESENFIRSNLLNDLTKKAKSENGVGVKALSDYVEATDQIFTNQDWGYFDLLSDEIVSLEKMGFSSKGENVAKAGLELFQEIQDLGPNLQKAILSSILENGLTTKEGIQKTLDSFKNDKTVTDTQVDEILTNINSQIIDNVNLGIQTATSNLLENWDDTSKELTKALSGGLEFKEAEALITKAESLGVSLDLNTDFVQNGDKLILISGKFNEYWGKLNEQSEKNAEEWQADIDAAQAVIDTRRNSIGKIRALSEEDKAAILAIDTNFDFDTYTTNGKLNTAGIIALQKAIQESSEGLERYNTYAEMAAQQLKQTQEWILGDYSSLSLSPETLKELSSGKTVLKREDYNLRAARENINSAYNSLISDVLSKGFDKINLEDYSGLIDAGEGIDLANTSYEDFVREYAVWAGKSIEETNALIIQAIEKDTQTTTGAAAEAVGKIQWLSDKKGLASLGDIQSLADALGISVDAILGEYNKQLDAYEVDVSQIDLSNVDNFRESVYDSINEFLKNITDGISKGISGKLSSADVTTLNGQLKQLGIEGLEKTDFAETAEGLKISQRAAIDLYTELKKIDALQGQLVFEDLAKSLEASDTNYTNISTTLARIAELEKAIKEMKPDDAKLQMYKNELAVAQEIARTRSSTDNKDFNFMDRALPTGMQNPIDYWNATGEAYKVMNTSAKSGYMEIQDFYNIVQEMSNMAQVSGQTLHFMGQEIDGSAEAAASLIQRGFSALTNVKGDGVKIALGNIGADFKTGATDMKGDFDSGIKEMAKAQIQMLDAAINMLEAIVAMENIDTSGDGILDLDELFIGGDATNGWTAQTETWFNRFETLSGGIEVGGVDLKTALLNMAQSGEDGAERVKQFMNDLKNIDWTLGDVNVAEKVHQLVQGLFVGQEITQGTSVFEVLKVPKNAEKTTDEFKNWVKETGLAAEEADTLIRILQNGYNISETGSDGKRNKYAEAVEKLLGLEKENQKESFEKFTKGNKITQEEITLFSELDIDWDTNGKITNAIYTASDGSKLTLSKDESSWQDEITKYEKQVSIAKNLGGSANDVDLTKTSPMKVKLTGGAEVEGAVTAIAGGVTASYHGQSQNFYGDDAYQQASTWIKQQAELGLYHIGESGGAITKRNEITGELEVVPAFTITGTPTNPTETEKEVQKIIDLKGKELTDYIESNTNSETGKITLPNIPIEFEEGTDASYIQEIVDKYFGDGTFDTLPGKIAEGITTAFTQDTSISEAIGQGIRTALTTGTGEDGQSQDIPLPTLNLKPESVTIQLGKTEPTLESSEESKDIPISEVTLKPTTILVNTDGATSSTEGETTPEVDVEGKIISYIDAGADKTALTAVKEIEGKIVSYLDNDAGVTGLTVAKDIDGTITSYLDTGADITGLTRATEIPGVIGSYTDPEASVSGLTVANAIKAIIALYEESSNVNDPSDYINDLTGEIISYSEASEVTKPEKIEGIIGYIKQYKNAEGTDPNNLLNNLTGTATITTNTPDINITTTAADTTWEVWKEKVEKDPLLIGIQPTPSQGEIPSSNPTPSPSSTPTPTATSSPTPTPAPTMAPSSNNSQISNSIDTSSITSAFDTAINSVVTKIGDISTEADKISSDKVKAIQDEQSKIEATNVKEIGTEESRIDYTNISMVKSYANAIDPAGAKAAQTAINAIPSSKNINLTAIVTVNANGGTVRVTGDGVPLNDSKRHIKIAKTGNVALAAGRDTLMGELGPEMVVSHGRYFVVGQNGPEMVNLAEDAIVFNHLQTEQLLRHGKASGHAKPVTNERKATSLATGNVGPAMASASAALDALKQLRSMWQSLLNASLKDLGGLAGGSGGGGGGGGGNDDATKGVLGNIERWYNWLQDIESTQVKINKLTKEYTLLEKQGASSNDRLKNLQNEYKQLQKNKETREQLVKEQTDYRKKLLKQVQTGKGKYGLLSAFYDGNTKDGTFTLKNDKAFQEFVKKRGTGKTLKSKGIKVQERSFYSEEEAEAYNKKNEKAIKEGKKEAVKAGDVNGSKKSYFKATGGLELFDKLQKTDQYGNLVYSADDQLKILEDLGFGAYLKKDASGNKLKTAEEKVEYFFSQIESGKGEIDALTDSINDQTQAALDDAISMQEINEQIREIYQTVPGVNEGLDKWYNYTRKIADEQNRLNKLTKENANLQKDQIGNGQEIYENYKQQLASLENSVKLNDNYLKAREKEADNLAKNAGSLMNLYTKTDSNSYIFNESSLKALGPVSYQTEGKIKTNKLGYEVDEKGQYVDDKGVLRDKNGKEVKDGKYGQTQVKGSKEKTFDTSGNIIDVINRLTAQDATGKVALAASEQYQIIKKMGLEEFIKYDENGSEIYSSFGEMSKEEQQKAVEVGINRIKETITELNENNDEIVKLEESNLDLNSQILDVQNALRDNSINVQNMMRDAIVQEHQDAIDQKKELTNAIKNAADKTISGLKDSLEKEKNVYDSDQDEKELTLLQMQLSTARVSGNSASKVLDLQKQIAEKQKEIYFNERQASINDLEDATNKQVEELEEQTNIMQSVLDYQVKYGHIWEEVNQKLAENSTEAIVDYILKNSPDYVKANIDEQPKTLITKLDAVGIYKSQKEDEKQNQQTGTSSQQPEVPTPTTDGAKVEDSATKKKTAVQNALNNLKTNKDFKNIKDAQTLLSSKEILNVANQAYDNSKATNDEDRQKAVEKVVYNEVNKKLYSFTPAGVWEDFQTKYSGLLNLLNENQLKSLKKFSKQTYNSSKKKTLEGKAQETMSKTLKHLEDLIQQLKKSSQLTRYTSNGDPYGVTIVRKYASGGEINFTGPAWVDGSKTKPEQIFNFEQMKQLKTMFLDNLATTQMGILGLSSITDNLPNTNSYNSINNEDNGVSINQLDFHMEVQKIGDGYDARQAGREAMEEIVRIARKSGNRSISRR